MSKRRTRLEPVGHFVVLVVAAHVVIGLGIWWWRSHRQDPQQDATPKNLVWVSPADFPKPATPPAATAAPGKAESLPTAAEQPKPAQEPTPMVAAGTPPPSAPPAKSAADDGDNLPKAIAIDPAKVAELMAKANATPAPKPAEPSPPPPPLPGTDVARYITISHPAPAVASPPTPGATLSDIAAQDAGTGPHIDSIDRAIIDAFLRVWTPPTAKKLASDQRTAHVDVTVNREGKLVKYKPTRSSGNVELDMSVLEAANRLDKIDATLPADYPHEFYEFQVNFHVE